MQLLTVSRIQTGKTGRVSSWDVSGRNGDAWTIPARSSRLENPVRFEKEIKVTIEHGHANHLGNEMASVAYWYADRPAKAIAIPLVEKRRRVPKVDGTWVISDDLRWPGHEVKAGKKPAFPA